MNLLNVKTNKNVFIKNVNLSNIKKRRLFDLGIIPGEEIKKEFSSIFNDPYCYKVRNSYIAIRNDDAKYIEVYDEK